MKKVCQIKTIYNGSSIVPPSLKGILFTFIRRAVPALDPKMLVTVENLV